MVRFGRRRFLTAVGATGALATPLGRTSLEGITVSTGPTERLLSLEPPDFPENLGFDAEGNLYVGITSGEIRRIPRELTDETGLERDDTEPVATFPGGVGGVSVDDGTVYAAVRPENDDPSGAYAIDADVNGEADPELLGAISGFPNDLLVDADDERLLVTESSMGRVYSVSLDGDDAEDEEAPVWSEGSLLAGEGSEGSFGANGLTFFGEGVLVANTDFGRLVYVPIDSEDDAGDPAIYVERDGLVGADGITAWGSIVYVAANRQNEVVRVLPNGKILLTAADANNGLQFPSDVVFGTVEGQRTDLFVCNFAVQADDPEPGVLRTGF